MGKQVKGCKMKIAQRCPHCKEFFVVEKKLDVCPFCDKALPKKIEPKVEPKQQKISFDEFNEEPSTDIIKEFVEVREQVQLLYNLVYGFLAKNNELIKSKKLSSEELCDFGFLCRGLENLFDELRKESKARKELCGSIIAYRLTMASVSDPTLKMRVQGQFATGTPDVKMQAALPKKMSPEYFQLTDHFGIPRNVVETGILKLDWKSVIELCTKLMHEGKTIPNGFGKQYPLYTTIYRKRKIKN